MRRLARRLLTLCSAVSLVLAVAVCALWVFTRNRTLAAFCTSWVDVSEDGPEGAETHWVGSSGGSVHYHYRPDVFQNLSPPHDPGVPGALYGITAIDPMITGWNWVDQTRSLGGVEVVSGPPPGQVTYSSADMPWHRVSVPHWLLFTVCAVLPLARIGHRAYVTCRNRLRMSDRLCVHCGYDLRASPDRCPECGTVTVQKVTT